MVDIYEVSSSLGVEDVFYTYQEKEVMYVVVGSVVKKHTSNNCHSGSEKSMSHSESSVSSVRDCEMSSG